MTDRYSGYVVVLERDIRDDDAEHVLGLLRNLKGVQSVQPVVNTPELMIAEDRAQRKIETRVLTALRKD